MLIIIMIPINTSSLTLRHTQQVSFALLYFTLGCYMCTTVASYVQNELCCCMKLIKWSVTLRILQDWTPVAETLRLNGANRASGEDLMPDWTVHVAVEINEAAFTLQARNCDDSVKKKRTKHTASYLLSSDSGLFCCSWLFVFFIFKIWSS